MALALGLENKRNVAIVILLFAGILGYAGYQVYNTFAGPSTPAAPTTPVTPSAAASDRTSADGPAAQKIDNSGIDPSLHLDKLAQSEDVRYDGSGRNIFSADSAPIAIPTPVKSARNTTAAAPAAPVVPAVPQPPAIDLKYFGYAQDENKNLRAFFIHGDDVFIARAGEIVDHRYKVDIIRPLNVVITDLAYNNTQTLAISAL